MFMCSGCRTQSEQQFNIIRCIKGKNTIITCVCDRCKSKMKTKYQILEGLDYVNKK